MQNPESLRSHIDVIDACFVHCHPASLSLALDGFADALEAQHDDEPAVCELRLAARAAYPGGNFVGARERYGAALTLLRIGGLGSDFPRSG
jgi:hypothetical protein